MQDKKKKGPKKVELKTKELDLIQQREAFA